MIADLLVVVIVLLLVLIGLLIAILRAVRDLPFYMAERLEKGPGLEYGPLFKVMNAMRDIINTAAYGIREEIRGKRDSDDSSKAK